MQPIDKFLFGLVAIIAIVKGGIPAIIVIALLVFIIKALEYCK